MIDRLQQRSDTLVLAFMIVLVLAINYAWLEYDTRPTPMRGDEIILFNRTLFFTDSIVQHGLPSFDQLKIPILRLSYGSRPPLYQLLSVPFILAFGRTMDSGVYLNLFFEAVLMIAIFNVGKLIKNGKMGLLAALMVVCYPPIIVYTRLYRPLFALTACTSLIIWFLLLLHKTRSPSFAWAANLTIVFGIFLHPTFLWGIILPVGLFYIYIVFINSVSKVKFSFTILPSWLLEKLRQPFVLTGLLPSGIVAICLALYWYAYLGNVSEMYANVVSKRGPEMLFLGFEGTNYPLFFGYFLTSPHAISSVMSILLVISILTTLFKREFSPLLINLMFIASYLILSVQITLGWRYFVQILPLSALITANWIANIRHKFISTTIATIAVAASVFNYAAVSIGVHDTLKPVVQVMGGFTTWCEPMFALYCPDPPARENWHQEEIIQIISNDPQCSEQPCNLMVSSMNPFFGVYTFTYYLSKDLPGFDMRFLNEGWGFVYETRIGYAFTSLLESEYVIYQNVEDYDEYSDEFIVYSPSYPYYDNYVEATTKIIRSKPPLFSNAHQEVAEFALPDGTTATLIKRVKPLTISEAEEVIAVAETLGITSISEYEVLISLDANDSERVQQLCQKASTQYGKEEVELNRTLNTYCKK